MNKKVAVVTGGAGAFGSAIAERLHLDGFFVVVSDADLERAIQTSSRLENSMSVWLDVTDENSVAAAVVEIVRHTERIDAIINNAGFAPSGGMTTTNLAAFDRAISINLRGAYLVTSAAMKYLGRSPSSRVVMIGSRTWLAGGNPAYTASKAGMVGLARTITQEIAAFGGTCNVVAPGPVDTEFVDTMGMGDSRRENFERYAQMTPLGRCATAEDIAAAVSFFTRDEASFVTGEVLHVAGGLQLAPKL